MEEKHYIVRDSSYAVVCRGNKIVYPNGIEFLGTKDTLRVFCGIWKLLAIGENFPTDIISETVPKKMNNAILQEFSNGDILFINFDYLTEVGR